MFPRLRVCRWGLMTSQSSPQSRSCAPASAQPAWRSRTWRSRCSRWQRLCYYGLQTRPFIQATEIRSSEIMAVSVAYTLVWSLWFLQHFFFSHPTTLLCTSTTCQCALNCDCSAYSRLTFPRGHFPRLAECAHFHYETVDFGNVQVSSDSTQQRLTEFSGFSSAAVFFFLTS